MKTKKATKCTCKKSIENYGTEPHKHRDAGVEGEGCTAEECYCEYIGPMNTRKAKYPKCEGCGSVQSVCFCKPQHTSTPWEVEGMAILNDQWHEIATTSIGKDCDENEMTTMEAHANAAFIVRVVNVHEALLTQLKETNQRLASLLGWLETPEKKPMEMIIKEGMVRIGLAIAKAEGKS